MNLREAIQKCGEKHEEIYATIGTVSNIDESAQTCTVSLIDGGADLLNVRYVPDSSATCIFTPKENSLALIVFLSEETAALVWASEYKKIEIKCGKTTFNIKEKFSLNNSSISFKELLNDFVDAVKAIKITSPDGLLPVDPVTSLPAINSITTKINQLFE